jgi:hypothetical protein
MAERRGCSLSRRRETAPSEPRALQQIRRPFKEAGDGWIDQEVFIHKTPSLSAGHRLARRVVRILRSGTSTERQP